ncbi:MAG: hypothetical protein KatS3mg118_3721 [Paracoccaceae bacterium]|nr:MAG: hypothetical protein KatS3mg118_3721 [Paracoccaceae bacterium]
MDRLPFRLKALMAATALVSLAAPFAAAQDSNAPLPPAADAPPAPELPAAADTVLATVNGTDITLGLLHLVYTNLPPQYQQLPGEILLPALLDQAINQILLAQAGSAEGLDKSALVRLSVENATRDAIAGAFIQKLIEADVTEEAIRADYDKRIAAMPEETEVNASHILVETEEEAKEIAAELGKGADFAELAKARSDGPLGKQWRRSGLVRPRPDGPALRGGRLRAEARRGVGPGPDPVRLACDQAERDPHQAQAELRGDAPDHRQRTEPAAGARQDRRAARAGRDRAPRRHGSARVVKDPGLFAE